MNYKLDILSEIFERSDFNKKRKRSDFKDYPEYEKYLKKKWELRLFLTSEDSKKEDVQNLAILNENEKQIVSNWFDISEKIIKDKVLTPKDLTNTEKLYNKIKKYL